MKLSSELSGDNQRSYLFEPNQIVRIECMLDFFYSLTPGVKDINPWIPASKLKRKWKIDALKKYYGKDSKCPVMKVKQLWQNKQDMLSGAGDQNHEGLYQQSHVQHYQHYLILVI